jgi:hypothetical protein
VPVAANVGYRQRSGLMKGNTGSDHVAAPQDPECPLPPFNGCKLTARSRPCLTFRYALSWPTTHTQRVSGRLVLEGYWNLLWLGLHQLVMFLSYRRDQDQSFIIMMECST